MSAFTYAAEFCMLESELIICLTERAEWLDHFVRVRIPSDCRRVLSAADVVQDIWIAAFRRSDTFAPQGPDSFDRWLMTIARTKLLDVIKTARRQKRDTRRARASVWEGHSFIQFVDLLASSGRTPSKDASSKEAVQAVRIALISLPEDERRAIMLVRIENNSLADAARTMGKSRPALRGLIRRGMLRLRDRLGSASDYSLDGL